MEVRVLCFLLFVGSMAKEDMERKVFIFPRQSISDYVELTPQLTEPLDKLTVCLRTYTDLSKSHALFSLDLPESWDRHMFDIFQAPIDYTRPTPFHAFFVYINNSLAYSNAQAEVLHWRHSCVTWDSDTGVLQLWVNGKVYPQRVLQKGSSIDLQKGISLGQMRRNYGTGWEPESSFQGEISDVHMWNEVLPPETIRQVLINNRYINGNVISWRSLNYTLNGDVIVQPKV
ncbi:C-reactive protein-like [Xenopus laevis]|uniref:Pentraxin family member n=1 Tax=Xenopus laevis TaxID=8355 RepID=A0A8J0TR47_XENLA|nr:C-reactive protein-like [Xenopus laevis]